MTIAPVTQRDHYEVLGVPRHATEKQIKDAFRTLALEYHTDRNKEPGAQDKFKEIAAAAAPRRAPSRGAATPVKGPDAARSKAGGANVKAKCWNAASACARSVRAAVKSSNGLAPTAMAAASMSTRKR